MPKMIAIYIVGIPVTLIILGICLALRIPEGLSVFFMLIAIIFSWILVESIYNKKNNEQFKNMSVCESLNSATLYKRCPESESLITIEPLYNTDYKYNPATITYTGATVGGVTTGGFHTTEAFYSEEVSGKSGKYCICAKYNDSTKMTAKKVRIVKINLTPEMVQTAMQDSFLSRFLVDSALILNYLDIETEKSESDHYVAKTALETGNQSLSWHMFQNEKMKRELTRDDCEKIKAWIGGRI